MPQPKGPLVTVIVPIYKAEAYLEQCVDSIRKQSYRNLELILIDDGSPDGCPKLCDAFAAADARIQVIHQENGGLSRARNAGLDRMHGDYVTFVDSDDYLHLDLVSALLHLAEEEHCDIAASRFYLTGDRKIEEISQPKEVTWQATGRSLLADWYQDAAADEQFGNVVMGRLYRAHIFQGLRFPAGMIYEDAAILFQVLLRCEKVITTNQKYYFYYFSPNSILRSEFSEKRFDALKALKMQMDCCKENKFEATYERAAVAFYMQIAHLRYDIYMCKWKNQKTDLAMLKKQEAQVAAIARHSKYYTPTLRMKHFLRSHLKTLTHAIISVKQPLDRRRIQREQAQC